MAQQNSSRAGVLALLCLSTAVALGAAEFALRALEVPERRGPLAWKTSVPWRAGINSLGFRGKEPRANKTRQRILLLGDSQLEGYHVRQQDTFATKLQQYLRHRDWQAEVVALGAGGWGTDQQLIALREYIDRLDPDLVVVFYTFQNDIWNSLFPTHLGTPKPTYQWRENALVPPDPALWRAASEEPRTGGYGLLPLLRRATSGYPTDSDWEAVLPARTPAPDAGADIPELAGAYAAALGLTLDENEDLRSERSHFAHLKDPATPRMLHAMNLQRALFREMKRETDARGVPLSVFRPLLAEDFWEGTYAHAGKAYTLSTRAAATRLRSMFEDTQIPLLEIDDLAPNHTWLPKDHHLNPLGNRIVAARVGDWLLAQRAAAAPE